MSLGSLYHDEGVSWNLAGWLGYPAPRSPSLSLSAGIQVFYYDRFTNDGVITIADGAALVGIR